MLAIIMSRNVDNYNSPKYWQLKFSEMLANIFVRNAGDKWLAINFSKNGDECQHLYFSEMLAIIFSRNVSNYNLPKPCKYDLPQY